ncbi:MAG: NAD(P)H-binding protein [Myxococcaceae bacterium]|nr:NAD(P)H-binding protein [Myxococcaceae bacterium]
MTAALRPRLVVAGSTGATGQVLVPLARSLGFPVVPLVRAKSAGKVDGGVTVDFTTGAGLVDAMGGAGAVIQCIGTMRHRFSSGDTYESSDIGTTRALVDAAKRAGSPHFILLGSYGTGRPVGAYLKAKAEAERVVKESGLPFTILRPSALVGGERKGVPLLKPIARALGLKGIEPITLDELSRALLAAAAHRAPLGVAVEGAPLWALVAQGQAL